MTHPINSRHELRHVKESKLTKLAAIVDKTKSWSVLIEQLAAPLKLSAESIQQIEQQFYCAQSPTLALLKHWSITGRRRPTIETLQKQLNACQLKWAQDYVRRKILKQKELLDQEHDELQPRISNSQTTQKPDKHDIDQEFQFENLPQVLAKLNPNCVQYSFESIYESTNRFCHRPFAYATPAQSGRRIGDGRFSSVFLALTHLLKGDHDDDDDNQHANNETKLLVAAKLLKAECNLDYLANEINLAHQIKHANILQLLGISVGADHKSPSVHDKQQPSYICLIYPYMQNGSLLECLDVGLRCDNYAQLNAQQRVDIVNKLAEAIAYLHNFQQGSIIHRDIKTANILIDAERQPKLGDFTLVRQLDSQRRADETQYSQNIIGTSVYMPPEAFRGDISTKFDIFSFGIVMLELLTGLKPFNDELGEDLLTFISEKLSDIDDKLTSEGDDRSLVESELKAELLRDLLDKKAGEWQFQMAKCIFDLALRATEVRKRERPNINEILEMILGIK